MVLSWFQFILFLHITGAVIAFSPNFVLPRIASTNQAEPMHANFGLRLMKDDREPERRGQSSSRSLGAVDSQRLSTARYGQTD